MCLASCSDGKADRRTFERCHQGQFAGELLRKGFLVVGLRRPGLLLRDVVILSREFLDAGAKDFRQHRRIVRQERPHRHARVGGGHHGALH